MRVIAAGRASEIVELGEGRILRRFKGGGRPAREAAIMEHARAFGFPVPQVLEVLDDALVLERIDGPTGSPREARSKLVACSEARVLGPITGGGWDPVSP